MGFRSWRRYAGLEAWVVAGVIVAGCGGGGGGDAPPSAAPVDLTIVVIDPTSPNGYAAGATVCFDADADLRCGAAEPAITADAHGEVRITLDAAAQASLAGSRLIATYVAVFEDPITASLGPAEVTQIAAPWVAPTSRVVMSPLVTWSEQLVLATMTRQDARAAVAELADLQTLAVDADFIAAAATPPFEEALRARRRATEVLPHQSAAAMQALRAPAAAYADAMEGDGVWLVSPRTPGSVGNTFSGSVTASGIDTIDPAAGPQWAAAQWTYDAATASYGAPPTVFVLDGLTTGPLKLGTAPWIAGPVTARRERAGARVYQVIQGVRTQVLMRSARALDGQPLDAIYPGNATPPPGIYPAGAAAFDVAVVASLQSHLDTGEPVPRYFGSVLGAEPTFTDFAAFRDHYRVADGRWFDLGTGQGIEMAFDAAGEPVFRSVTFGVPVDEGAGTIETFAFLGETVTRVVAPVALAPFITLPLDYVAHSGVLRPAVVQQRGELNALRSRSLNRLAAQAQLDALLWGLPPGAP